MPIDNMMDALQMVAPDDMILSRLPIPELRSGEVLIKTAFVGVCGTDVNLWQGRSFYYDQGFAEYPFVFGHEFTGHVVGTNGVQDVRKGDRVVGHCMVECHMCDKCHGGRRHHCRNLKEVGLRYIAGAAADYVAVPGYAVTRVPDNLSLLAATLVEPSVTAYHAIERVALRADDRVAIIGSGTLGLLSLLIAKLYTPRVDIIGVEDSELQFANALGADRVLQPADADGGSYSVVIEASGSASSAALASYLLDLGGRCAVIGVCNQPAREFKPSFTTMKDLTLHGILHGLDYYPKTVSLFASGRVDPTQLIAEVGRPGDAESFFRKMCSPNRTKPKYIIQFAGETS